MSASLYDSLCLDNQLCFPLYAASRQVIRQYRPLLDALDLTYTQYIAMMVVWQEKQVSVKELGQKLLLDSGTLTPVLKSLEAKGYVRRTRSPHDERVLLVGVTDKGNALKEQALAVPRQMACHFQLTSEEALQLYTLLHKVIDGCADKEEKTKE